MFKTDSGLEINLLNIGNCLKIENFMIFKKQKKTNHKMLFSGFSLVELIVGVAVFLVIVVAVYNAYIGVFNVVYASRAKIEAIALVNEQLEIVRNLPYSSVGEISGIPSGVLNHTQTIVRNGVQYTVLTTVRNVDDPFDGTLGGLPNDLSPADHKTVEIEISCLTCKVFTPIVVTTWVSPKNLETASTNGALFVRVFDANGNPVPDASVHIENNAINPAIIINDSTNVNGMLQIVDAPPGVNAYEITVTKTGYSTDKTYAVSGGNPHPSKPHATVLLQQVTQLSFVIDKLSTFNISSVASNCASVSGVDFSLQGSKTIGANPTVYKYSQNKVTDDGGHLTLNNIEWDGYQFTNIDSSYELVGINPPVPTTISPNSTQDVQLVVAPRNPNTLLVTVRDSVTGLPLSGVLVELSKAGFSETNITGQGYLGQTDWSGGAGQATSTDATKYFSSDGNIETQNPVGDVLLKKVFGDYVSSGVITSSTFDTGSASNFQQLSWNPTDQPPSSGTPNIRVQIATNADGGVWNFFGPDDTAGTYYTSVNKNISNDNNGNRYLRYKLFLDTAVTTASPNISDLSFTFTSQCTPPGQVSFSGLLSEAYTLHMTKDGYNTQDVLVNISSMWQSEDIIFTPL